MWVEAKAPVQYNIESSICADGSPDPSDVSDYEVGRLWRAVRTNTN
jgi:hypothetical protein